MILRFLSDLNHLLYYVRDILGLVLLNFFLHSRGVVFSAVAFFSQHWVFGDNHVLFPTGFLRDII